MLQGMQLRSQPLPVQPWIQAHQCPGGLMYTPCAFLGAVLPGLLQLQQQIIDVLLPCFNQPVWLTQHPARHEML
jgi:hypothetical protein